MPRRAPLLVVVLAVALVAAPAGAVAQEPDCPRGASCATLPVPLDPAGDTPGTEEIAYARLPATGARSGTLVFLAGGPGEAAIPLARPVGRILRPLRESYDMVFVDQRGTGASGAVECEVDAPDAVGACAERLGQRRAFLTTRATAYDVERLRGALGASEITVLGVSYGAKVAQAYARLFPERTAAVILDSPTPVDGLDSAFELRQVGLKRSLREVCQPGLCKATLRNAGRALDRVAERLAEGPATGRVVGRNGRAVRERITQDVLYGLILASDTAPALRVDLPGAIGSAAQGDWAPLLRLASFAGSAPADPTGGVNTARLLATTCVEGRLPWRPGDPTAGREELLAAFYTEREDAFAPFTAATVAAQSAASLCTAWPPTPAPAPVLYGGPDVPVLVLSGREDLRTPLEDARRTAAQYPDAQVLGVPDVGHSVLGSDTSGCAVRRTVTFLAGGEVTPCARRARPLPPLPVIPPSVDPLPGAPRSVRSTGAAVSLSLFAVTREAARLAGTRRGLPVPALRAGRLVAFRDRVELQGVEWIRGVRLDGVLRVRGRSVVAVSGPRAAAGLLRAGRGAFRGTLGGERVAVRP